MILCFDLMHSQPVLFLSLFAPHCLVSSYCRVKFGLLLGLYFSVFRNLPPQEIFVNRLIWYTHCLVHELHRLRKLRSIYLCYHIIFIHRGTFG